MRRRSCQRRQRLALLNTIIHDMMLTMCYRRLQRGSQQHAHRVCPLTQPNQPSLIPPSGNAFALFLKSQRKWDNPALQDDHRDQFRNLCIEHKYDGAK